MHLSNMHPSFSAHNVPDYRAAYTKIVSNLTKQLAFRAFKLDLRNVLFGKLCIAVMHTSILVHRHRTFPTPFSHTILEVIRLSAYEQVVGIYAARIVANVAHIHSLWDWAKAKLEYKAMHVFAIAVR